jgi:hypothetical protein
MVAPSKPRRKNERMARTTDLLPRFQEWLRQNADAAASLPHGTRYRYLKGEVSATLEWFIDNPEALRLLAEDAERMDKTKREKLRAVIRARAAEAKSRRAAEKKAVEGKRK